MSSFIAIYPYCLIFCSIVIIGLSFYKIWCSNNAQNWKEVPAKITQLKILVKDFMIFKVYTPKVEYSILQEGKIVYKHRFTISKLSFYKKDEIDALFKRRQLAVGQETVAYQNPIFKSSYILVPGLEKKSMFIAPILLLVFSAGNLIYHARVFTGFSKPYEAVELYDQSFDLMEKGQHEEAYVLLKKSQSLDSAMLESYYLELELAPHLPNTKTINMRCYDKILSIDSSKANIRYNRGLLFYESQRYGLAIQDFKKYLKQQKDADGAYNLAFCYLNLGINDSAKMVLENPIYRSDSDCRKLLETIE